MSMLNGIDVSNVNGPVDWAAYRGKIGFAGVKVSEGCWFSDPLASVNIAACRSLGIPVIGYHFLHANTPGSKQAEYFLSHAHQAGLRPGDLIAIDAEDGGLDGLPVSHLVAASEEFTAELQKHWRVFWPELYTEISLASEFTTLGNCPLWLANPSRVHTGPLGPWPGPSFEQVGQRGVDVDVFYGDAAALAKLAIPHG